MNRTSPELACTLLSRTAVLVRGIVTLVSRPRCFGGWSHRAATLFSFKPLSGPLDALPELRFEIPMSVTLDANQNVSSDAREELAHALRSCRRAAANSALAAWAAGLTDRVLRLDAVGDVGRLLCRGLRDGVAAEPLWL